MNAISYISSFEVTLRFATIQIMSYVYQNNVKHDKNQKFVYFFRVEAKNQKVIYSLETLNFVTPISFETFFDNNNVIFGQ